MREGRIRAVFKNGRHASQISSAERLVAMETRKLHEVPREGKKRAFFKSSAKIGDCVVAGSIDMDEAFHALVEAGDAIGINIEESHEIVSRAFRLAQEKASLGNGPDLGVLIRHRCPPTADGNGWCDVADCRGCWENYLGMALGTAEVPTHGICPHCGSVDVRSIAGPNMKGAHVECNACLMRGPLAMSARLAWDAWDALPRREKKA